MRRLAAYLRQIRRRRLARPDDDLDGCALDFKLDPTRDEDVDRLLIPEHRGAQLRGAIFLRVLAHHRRHEGTED